MFLLIYNDLVNNKCSIINKAINNSDDFKKYCVQIFTLLNKKHDSQLYYVEDPQLFTINKKINIVNSGWFYNSVSYKVTKVCEIKLTPIHVEYTNYINELELSLDELINLNNLFSNTLNNVNVTESKTEGSTFEIHDTHGIDDVDMGNCTDISDDCPDNLINMIMDDNIELTDESSVTSICSNNDDHNDNSNYNLDTSQTYKRLFDEINPTKVTYEYNETNHDENQLFNTNFVNKTLDDIENDDSLNNYMDNYTHNKTKSVYLVPQSTEPSKFIDKLNTLLKVNPLETQKYLLNSDSYYNELHGTTSTSTITK
jgi:hypothetical protein